MSFVVELRALIPYPKSAFTFGTEPVPRLPNTAFWTAVHHHNKRQSLSKRDFQSGLFMSIFVLFTLKKSL